MDKLFLLMTIHLAALASPGPDFLMILKSSLSDRVKSAVYCSVGIALGVLTHLIFVYLGVSLLISQSVFLYKALVFVGASWLIYTGAMSLKHTSAFQKEAFEKERPDGILKSFRNGFLTNLLNPKAMVYFTAIISPLLGQKVDSMFSVLVLSSLTILTFFWFALMAFMLRAKGVKHFFLVNKSFLDRLFSVAILLLGFYLIYTEVLVNWMDAVA